MGIESLPGVSPAHRRSMNPQSPSPFRRTLSAPDVSWRSLAHRHKFLLYMLGLLTFLCTVYLYFAITLGTRDSCSGLGGTQRALCQLASKTVKTEGLKAHHRRLMVVEESDPVEDIGGKRNMKEFVAFVSSLASRKDLKEKSTDLRDTISVSGQQWDGDIAKFKAMLDSLGQAESKKRDNAKLSKGSRLRGNF